MRQNLCPAKVDTSMISEGNGYIDDTPEHKECFFWFLFQAKHSFFGVNLTSHGTKIHQEVDSEQHWKGLLAARGPGKTDGMVV